MIIIISEIKHQNGQKLHEKVLQKKERKKEKNECYQNSMHSRLVEDSHKYILLKLMAS